MEEAALSIETRSPGPYENLFRLNQNIAPAD